MGTEKIQFSSDKLEELLEFIEFNTPVSKNLFLEVEAHMQEKVKLVYAEINGNMLNYKGITGWNYHQWVQEQFRELSFPSYIQLCTIWIRSKVKNLTPMEREYISEQIDAFRDRGIFLEHILPKKSTTYIRYRYIQSVLYRLEQYEAIVNDLMMFVWEQLSFNTQADMTLNPDASFNEESGTVHLFPACGIFTKEQVEPVEEDKIVKL